MGTKCPTCGRDDFSSKKGMRTHHKISHGKSLKISVECDFCDKVFKVLPYRVENENIRFCSSRCQHEAQKNRVMKNCLNCDNSFEAVVSEGRHYCSWDCRKNGLKKRETTDCEWCGKSFEYRKSTDRRFCSVECTENWFSSEERPTSNGKGENHWAYIDGNGSTWYGPNWKDARDAARSRVEECEYPDCEKSNSLQCHHIVPFRYFDDYENANDTENLMMLCPKHHTVMDSKIRKIERASEADGYDT